MSFRELGARAGLSANAAAERVRRLEHSGAITAFTVVVDPEVVGRHLGALIDVRLAAGTKPELFEAELERLPAVVSAEHLTGRSDYQLRVACRDPGELDETIRTLKGRAGVVETETRIVLRTALRRAAA